MTAILWSGIGVLTAIMSGGASLLLTSALVGLAIAASATAIAAVVVSDTNPELSAILGWVSLGLTVVGGVATLLMKVGQLALYLARSGIEVAKKLIDKGTVSLVSSLKRLSLYRGSGKLPAQIIQSGTKRIDRVVTHFADDALIPFDKSLFDGKFLIKQGEPLSSLMLVMQIRSFVLSLAYWQISGCLSLTGIISSTQTPITSRGCLGAIST
ncbi:hypothetical protein DJ564_06200 [Pseudomonas sp. 31-12]|uniref:hypothetical protein n=1 Tax=Pseudomonas sp. 31-12 TaxID=2201356 RepID=UPI000D6BCCA6|nr:hypothetical protein [Pseudomonas sp. 31-12]AWM90439.1 hypothetical protein DJ564_06200 [Pseudomonas sp. 31-12]